MDITERDVAMSVDIVLTTQHVTMLPELVLMDVNLDTKHQIVLMFVAMGTTELHATCNVANFAKLHTTAIPFRDFVKVVVLLAGKESIV